MLCASVAEVGLTDADIDVVVLSHLHFDHVGGLLEPFAEGQPARLLFPKARFVGLSSMDRDAFDLPDNVSIKLDEQDKRRAGQMLNYPWFNKKSWQREIRTMVQNGVKFELEALSAKGISYISEQYLPKKMKDKMWLA